MALASKITRSLQLSLLAKDLAHTSMAPDRASKSKSRSAAIKRMAALRGLPQKLGQILSLSELQSDETAYTELTEAPQSMSSAEAMNVLEKNFQFYCRAKYICIERSGIAASIGQVHKGILANGTKVAVKIQYPEIADAVKQDLNMLGWLSAPLGGLHRGYDLTGYRNELGARLTEELDYRHEAAVMAEFRRRCESLSNVRIPEVIPELSNERVLTMTWLDGVTFARVRTWSRAEKRCIARTLLKLFLNGCFKWHLLHGDPHPGNYRFERARGPAIVGVLDFGCVKRLDEERMNALAQLIQLTMQGRLEQHRGELCGLYAALGFNAALLAPMSDRLEPFTRLLFEPFAAETGFNLREWDISAETATILGPHRQTFRIAGPPDLLFFIRAYQGLVQYLRALNVPIFWREAFEELELPDFTRRGTCSNAPFEASGCAKSKHLRIHVEQDGRMKASLTFPSGAVENLSDIVPPDLISKLDERRIDLSEIVRAAFSNQLEPAELFRFDEGGKSVRVWLE